MGTKGKASGKTNRKTGSRGRQKGNPTKSSFWIVMLVIAFIAVFYQFNSESPIQQTDMLPPPTGNEIRVCFLDVGQGDSTLIQTQDNAVLIDAGEYSARRELLAYLREAGVETLDYVVATHPHSDHIGSMALVIEEFDVKNILMPDATHNTATFEKLVDAIEAKAIPITIAKAGDTVKAGLISFTVLAPAGDSYSNLNNYSVVLRMVHGETAFLFTGDAEHLSENEMLDSGRNLRANILKSGHHGSRTASSDAFMEAVNPNAVVISCGINNTYGHPHEETLDSYSARNISVYRTDQLGTIIMTTDGKVISLYTAEEELITAE